MREYCYVLTNLEAGWDCVSGVYFADSEEEVAEMYLSEMGDEDLKGQSPLEWMEEHSYIIHQTSVSRK